MRDETMKTGCDAKREGDVASAMNRMDKNLTVLSETVSLLSDRFLPVLQPSTPEAVCPEKQDTEPRCDLSGKLHQHNRTIQQTNEWLRSIIDRCEL